ncbi:hypothetical protein NSQ77_19935 [Oceanobacillus sp. FSL K6-2867]|uniref:hypothetical protein n=1 Tax=Oceanobacillus sp. FSL K6-2867 TaxID=2954748 RepID=UPI0030D7056D
MKCPKCEEQYYFLQEKLERPFKMIVIKCGNCDTAISTMEYVDIEEELLEIRNQLDEINRSNKLMIDLLVNIFNVDD